MNTAIGQVFEWLLIFCAFYFIVKFMFGKWDD